ncbi:MAG: ribose-phosphate diphosphokinase [Candidatus Aenigmarchaeota archaeon]|nr:ribose-phosphate diphosphokinase [Candidatus Aenigmarchaeota archaeon]
MGGNNKPVILKTKFSYPMADAVNELLPETVRKLGERYSDVSKNARDLKFEAAEVDITRFNCGEYKARSPHLVDREVYLFHDATVEGGYRPNDFVALATVLDDSLRNAEPKRITHVVPHVPYQRQDKEHEEHESVTAKRVMRYCFYDPESPIPTRMFTFDMHNPDIARFVPYRVKELYASPIFIQRFKDINCALIAPDANAAKRLEAVAARAGNKGMAIVYKTRSKDGRSKSLGLMGAENLEDIDVAVTIDDMIDTGGSNVGAIDLIRSKAPAVKIVAAATHGVFSYDHNGKISAEERLRKSGISVVVTDAVRRPQMYLAQNADWLEVESLAPILAEAIARRELGLEVSEMFR